ncbi:MAG: hypothetical protein ACR2QJ_15035, partial [Geminicoccaceae bacterium]
MTETTSLSPQKKIDDAQSSSTADETPGRNAGSLVLISWYFPPDNAVAAIRLGKMARFLERTGQRVRVITPEALSGDRSLAVEIDQRAITRTRYLDLDHRFNPIRRSRPGSSGSAVPPSIARRCLGVTRRFLGGIYRSIAFYPDKRADWT